VGAIAVHGACGAWGALALGLLADGSYGEGWNGVAGPVRGLLFGDASQFLAQLIGIATNAIVVFALATDSSAYSIGSWATACHPKWSGPGSTRWKWVRKPTRTPERVPLNQPRTCERRF